MFDVFDYPNPGLVSGNRNASTVPTQALFMMNSEFVEVQAAAFAGRILVGPSADDAARISAVFIEAYGRHATEQEVQDSLAFLEEMRMAAPAGEEETFPWTRLCHVVLSASEFIYLD